MDFLLGNYRTWVRVKINDKMIMMRFVLCNLPGGVSEKEVGGKLF